MSYTPTTLPNLEPGEHAFQLDTGEYVAAKMQIERDPRNSLLRFVATARQVDSSGMPVLDAHSNPITATHVGNMTAVDLPAHGGVNGYAKMVLDIVLGEPSALMDANDDIRDAIMAAAAANTAVDLTTLR